MKKFKKSELCHRCMISDAFYYSRCTRCNLCLCTHCYYHYTNIDEKYHIKINYPEVTCYNCQENQRVMNKIDCWLAVHGCEKRG